MWSNGPRLLGKMFSSRRRAAHFSFEPNRCRKRSSLSIATRYWPGKCIWTQNLRIWSQSCWNTLRDTLSHLTASACNNSCPPIRPTVTLTNRTDEFSETLLNSTGDCQRNYHQQLKVNKTYIRNYESFTFACSSNTCTYAFFSVQ